MYIRMYIHLYRVFITHTHLRMYVYLIHQFQFLDKKQERKTDLGFLIVLKILHFILKLLQ